MKKMVEKETIYVLAKNYAVEVMENIDLVDLEKDVALKNMGATTENIEEIILGVLEMLGIKAVCVKDINQCKTFGDIYNYLNSLLGEEIMSDD